MELKKVFKESVLDYPRHLVVYAKPKMGKTDLISRLPDCALIDIEDGTEYVTGYVHKVYDPDPIKTLANLDQVLDWLIKEKPYKYVSFDTMTKLEECTIIQGTLDYMNSSQGKKFNVIDEDLIESIKKTNPEEAKKYEKVKGAKLPHTNPHFKVVETLPEGYGYRWSREAFKRYSDKMIETKAGSSVSGREIDLTGKLKSITASFNDSIAYLTRNKAGNTCLSFKAGEAVAEGTRDTRLSNNEFEIGFWNKQSGNYSKVDWSPIYPDEQPIKY